MCVSAANRRRKHRRRRRHRRCALLCIVPTSVSRRQAWIRDRRRTLQPQTQARLRSRVGSVLSVAAPFRRSARHDRTACSITTIVSRAATPSHEHWASHLPAGCVESRLVGRGHAHSAQGVLEENAAKALQVRAVEARHVVEEREERIPPLEKVMIAIRYPSVSRTLAERVRWAPGLRLGMGVAGL